MPAEDNFINISDAAKKLKLSIDQVMHLIEDGKLTGYGQGGPAFGFMSRYVGGIPPFEYWAMKGQIKTDGDFVYSSDCAYFDNNLKPLDINDQPYTQPPFSPIPLVGGCHVRLVMLNVKEVEDYIQKARHLKKRPKSEDPLIFVIREAVRSIENRRKRWTHRDVLGEIKVLKDEDRRVKHLVKSVDTIGKIIYWTEDAWAEEARTIFSTSMKTISRQIGDLFPKSERKASK